MPNLNDYLLNSTDVLAFDTPTYLYTLPDSVNKKISASSALLKSSYIIDKTKYQNVYITSDIHADLVKLHFLLIQSGLIKREQVTEGLDWILRLIVDTEWVAENTLFIIVGDIVDGRRKMGPFTQAVPDAKGNIELLLHAYLYNLRIKAREKGSEIRFTIGNHDYHTVIKENSNDLPDFYNAYVHQKARNFFGSRAGRRNCLLPFYNCCPYVLLALGSEIACIHAGFTVYTTNGYADSTVMVKNMQALIDSTGDFSGLTDLDNVLLSRMRVSASSPGLEGSPLWSRRYAHGPPSAVCSTIDAEYTMVVVGHCQTGYECCVLGQHTRSILAGAEYTKYNCHNDGGCVLVGCHNETGPHLAFVDIAMSRAFTPTKPLDSRAEMLHLSHNGALDASRYYNVINRTNVGGDGGASELVWSAAKVGGARRSKKRVKTRKTYRVL